ncbi:AAA family ATPase [Formosa sp. S-31]|uniref:AAA family ATPase n=1 Tax=Formosa sp. S-31 TaxID=2790949 RepID=UPI003EB90EEA
MNQEQKQDIAHKLQEYINLHAISQTIVSDRTGVRKEYITSILKGVFTYDAGKGNVGDIPNKHFMKLAELLDYTTEKQYWVNRATPQLTQMIAVLEEAREHAYTRLIVGETGSGKSHAISLYAKKHPADVFHVKVGSEDTLNGLLEKVCAVLKVPPAKHKSSKIRDIALSLKMLYNYGKKPQLIFDESEYLKVSALCSIKEFYDYLDKYCSIVLIGTSQLTGQIDKLRKKDAKGIPQLYRRIKFGIRHLPSIDRTFKLFLNEVEDRQLRKFLQEECDNYGELHDVLVPCMREADRLSVPLSLPLVERVLNIKRVNMFV